MNKGQKYFETNRAALFDWLVFMTSTLLGFVFKSLLDFLASPGFSYWIFGGLVAYIIGTWLKKRPLYERMQRTGDKPEQIPILLILLIGHWLIIFAVFLFSESAMRYMLHEPQTIGQGKLGGFMISFGMFFSIFMTWYVYHPIRKFEKITAKPTKKTFYRELTGDILLYLSISFFTFAFWDKGIMTVMSNGMLKTPGDIFVLFLALSMAFGLFYLPLRYLFLLEDHHHRQTWQRLILIFGLILLRSLLTVLM
jgi:hypothetical protein